MISVLWSIWIELVSKSVTALEVNSDAEETFTKKAVNKFLASPGEFPYAVVLLNGDGEMFAGILVTDDTLVTTCQILIDELPEHVVFPAVQNVRMTAIGSNGDWVNDPNRQNLTTDYVFLRHQCLKITDQYYVQLWVVVLRRRFSKTAYINALVNRAVMKTAQQWKRVILTILDNANCHRATKTKCVPRDFLIGGYICPGGKCSKDSPMFRMITRRLEDDECHKLICSNISCKHFTQKTLQSTGTLCFPTDGIGGPGSPVAFERVVIAVGNFVKRDHLIATRFDKGYELVDALLSTAERISGDFVLWAGICTLLVGLTNEYGFN